jgi:hypothetical protein
MPESANALKMVWYAESSGNGYENSSIVVVPLRSASRQASIAPR